MGTARRIVKNMLFLSIAEIANKGITLIAWAYLARVLLPNGMGIFTWAITFVTFFVFFVDLGFNVVGPREIAADPDNTRKYVNHITSIRSTFAVIMFLILVISVYFINKPIYVKYVLLIAGLNIFTNAILYNWVFQGLERMEIIAIRQVATGLLNLAGIFILVHTPNDIIIATAITIGSLMINSVWMLLYYVKLFGKIKFLYDRKIWEDLLKASVPIAMTLFITLLYNTFSIFLLGLLRTDYETGIYGVAWRVIAFLLVPSSILQSAFIPQLSRSKTIEDKQKYAEKYVLLNYMIGTIISVCLFTYPEYIIKFFGPNYHESVIILKYLSFMCLFAYMNVAISVPLLGWKYERTVFWVILTGGVFNLILNSILIPRFGIQGAAFTAVSTEFLVLIGLSIIMYSKIKRLYILNLILELTLAVIASVAGYFLMVSGFHPVFSASTTLVIFISLNFVFKVITLQELKSYLKKN